MSVETDTLKVLQKLEEHFRSSSAMGGGTARAPYRDAKDFSNRTSPDDKKAAKTILATAGHIDTLGRRADRASTNLHKLSINAKLSTAGLGGLTTEFGKAITQFTSAHMDLKKVDLGSQLAEVNSGIKTLGNLLGGGTNDAVMRFESLMKDANQTMMDSANGLRTATSKPIGTVSLSKKFGHLEKALTGVAGNGGFLKQVVRATRTLQRLANSGRGGSGGGGGGRGGRGGLSGADADGPAEKKARAGFLGYIDKIGKGLSAIGITGIFKEAFSRIGQNLSQVADDVLQEVMARGFSASPTALIDLYKNAALAGMSLQEYVKLMEENVGLLSRSSTFAEFDKRLDKTRGELSKFGIFGIEATNMAAAMQQSASTLGVPMAGVADSASSQIEMFEKLRKTTGITAEAFTELVKEMKDNEVVQRELIGLAPSERAARLSQLQDTMTWGKQLGLSEQAQRQLTEALLAQRKSTVKERFLGRGRVTQAFALAGMSTDQVERGRELASKRMKTPEEEKELAALMGEFKTRAEAMKQSGNTGMAYQIEAMEDKLRETVQGPMLDAAGAVKLAKDSGPQIQKDFNQKVGELGQMMGRAVAVLEGMSKSPVLMAAAGGAFWLANAALTGKMVAWFMQRAGIGGLGGGMGPIGPNDGPQQTRGGKMKGQLGRNLASGAGRAMMGGAVVGGALFGISEYMNAEETAKAGDGDVGKAKSEAIGSGLGATIGGVAGSALGLALAPFTFGLSALITPLLGIAGSFVGGWAGKLLGGWIGSESATEKQTKATKKNTEELIKANRSTAGSTMIGSDLGGLNANLLRTGKAYGTSSGVKNVAEGIIIDPETGQIVSSPTPQQQSKVNPALVNNAEPETPKSEAVAAKEAAKQKALVQDPQSVLQQILDVLKMSLSAENTQIDLASQLIKAIPGSKFMSTQDMLNKTIAE